MDVINEIDEITNLAKSLTASLMLANANNDKAYNNVTLACIISERLEALQTEIYKQ